MWDGMRRAVKPGTMRTPILALATVVALSSLACSSAPGEEGDFSEDELTSLTARQRTLRFDGVVYVRDGASDAEILSAVKKQTQSAFGALRTSEISVKSRELAGVDPSTFKKSTVTVIDTNKPGDTGTKMTKVTYRYTDDAVVPVSMARRTSMSSAVLRPDYWADTQRILKECTANDSHAREFASSIWYVFEPSVSSCRAAMAAQQKLVDADRAKLADPKSQVAKSEVERLYVPVTISLGADRTNKGKAYPEYDRLWSGGVKPNTLVVSFVNGMIDHESHTYPSQDSGWGDWMDELRLSTANRSFKLVKIEPEEDLTSFDVNGKKIAAPNGIFDVMAWESGRWPAGLSYADRDALMGAASKKLARHWITLQAPVRVKIGAAEEKTVNVEILTYFGAESSSTPHKYAIKNSDVFLYNGHSYIGYGPLDPSNFRASDFPSSYQILFIDGCVSYNYYNADYVPLKSGGTKNLDIIVNGMEAPAWRSGWALGQFVQLLLSGKQASYLELLAAAGDTDSLRVVDGEIDNQYSPTKTPITVR